MDSAPVTITPEQNIVGEATFELKRQFSNVIQGGQVRIKLDLSKVAMIDSIGIGVLVATTNHLKEANGEFTIVNLSAELRQLFTNMRIIEFLDIR